MRHRHLNPGHESSVAAVEDVLARGSLHDWQELAQKIREDPFGRYAQSLAAVLEHRHFYGTTHLWRDWLSRVQATASIKD